MAFKDRHNFASDFSFVYILYLRAILLSVIVFTNSIASCIAHRFFNVRLHWPFFVALYSCRVSIYTFGFGNTLSRISAYIVINVTQIALFAVGRQAKWKRTLWNALFLYCHVLCIRKYLLFSKVCTLIQLHTLSRSVSLFDVFVSRTCAIGASSNTLAIRVEAWHVCWLIFGIMI